MGRTGGWEWDKAGRQDMKGMKSLTQDNIQQYNKRTQQIKTTTTTKQ